MPEHYSSILWIAGGVLALLALWYLSYRYVRWDTGRRRVRELERKAWIAAAVVLPLFGFALYLFKQVLERYLTPPAPPSTGVDLGSYTEIRLRPTGGHYDLSTPLSQVPMPDPAWGGGQPDRARVNGGSHAQRTPATIPSAYQPLRVHFALVALEGPHLGQHFLVNALPALIGRGADAAVSLEQDLNVSRRHAEIYEWNGGLHLRDLGSAHGTFVNGSRAVDLLLHPGDRLVIGKSALILRELP
jgi:hypothetical protein